MINIRMNEKTYQEAVGITLERFFEKHFGKQYLLAKIDNKLAHLSSILFEDCTVTGLDDSSREGHRAYINTLIFLCAKALHRLNPELRLRVNHSYNEGVFCFVELRDRVQVDHEYVSYDLSNRERNSLKKFIREEITKDSLIERCIVSHREANGTPVIRLDDSIASYHPDVEYHIQRCGDFYAYFYSLLAPRASYVSVFDIKAYNHGIVLLGVDLFDKTKSSAFTPQPKLFTVYQSAIRWKSQWDVFHMGDVNETILKGEMQELVHVEQAKHENAISRIADRIFEAGEKGKIILIAGPSSAGKTTFAERLKIQLRIRDIHPISISTDNYFLNTEDTPLDDQGEPDFEGIEAIDLELFNKHLYELLMGNPIEQPIFDFKSSSRRTDITRTIQIDDYQPLILEGLHSLNPRLTLEVPSGNKFGIFISPLTPMNLDRYNRITATDLRLMRRIARDSRTRGKSVHDVITALPKLMLGEKKYIFPFQEHADEMFNSSLLFELNVLKKYVLPHLLKVDESDAVYSEAVKLIKIFELILDYDDEKSIYANSFLREFIGGSAFDPH